MVGLSASPHKASHFVATYLQYNGYRVIPVNPAHDEILGERCYPDLDHVPETVDLVDVFRPAADCPAIAEAAVECGAGGLWLQLGIISLEAARIAEAGGLDVVMVRCITMEHGRYSGTMHWVGMNTGIITARRARRWF
jgi:predicted CoA-binding protein